MKRNLLTPAILFAVSLPVLAADTVKVFILAGQSNMEGKASQELLDFQATDPKTKDFYTPFRTGDAWTVRDDVFVKFLGKHGPLTVGFGSNGRTGPELGFGYKMGEKLDEPVLLIKAAWGGHSLFEQFRPPSAGSPSDEALATLLKRAQDKVERGNKKSGKDAPLPTIEQIKEPFGMSYRYMLKEVEDTKANYETLFPELKGKKLEIAGFVWFQGFNDMVNDTFAAEYSENLKHLISDVRKDLNQPNLPFVIAAIGNNGSSPAKGGMLTVSNAQMSMSEVPEFKGNVKAFRTDLLVDTAAAELYPKWKENFEEWKKVGSDRPYHYYGSGIWYTRIGQEMGDAMIELLKQ